MTQEHRTDAEFLRSMARRLSYDVDHEAATKHSLNEIAMRIETGFYKQPDALEHLNFVERWVNHHGQKPHMTPAEVVSVLQHYPPIKAITRSYADGVLPPVLNMASVGSAAALLVQTAEAEGVVLTVEQRPLQPLAMGNYETVVDVRLARGKA